MRSGTPGATLWAALLASWLAGMAPAVPKDEAQPQPETRGRVDYASSASRRTASR